MTIRSVPRSRDNIVLLWIKLRCAGKNAAEIGRMSCHSTENVWATIERIKKDDIEQSPAHGDDPDEIRKAYWP